MNTGVAFALASYLLWGAMPIYLRWLAPTSTAEILAQRIVWSLVTMAVLLLLVKRTAWIVPALRNPAGLVRFAATAALISCNWIVYIWAVNSDHVVDASLGYFINPLVNVLIGALFLRERMRFGQKVAIGVAAVGVGWLTWQAGSLPWIGLALALSFSLYGLLRRSAPLGALEGFAVETALLAPVALAYMAWLWSRGALAFSSASPSLCALFIGAGPVTTVPLLLFAAGARRISFSLLGVLQYAAPSLQWLIGIFLFHESFDPLKALGFGFVWVALAMFAGEGIWYSWQRTRVSD